MLEVDERAWRPSEWLKAAGNPFSRPTLYSEIHAGRIDAQARPQHHHLDVAARVFRELAERHQPAGLARAQAGGDGMTARNANQK